MMKREDVYIIAGIIGVLETVLFIGFCFILMSVSSVTSGYYGLDFHVKLPIAAAFIGFASMIGYGVIKKIYYK